MHATEMRGDSKSRRLASNAVHLHPGETQTASEFVRLASLRRLSDCQKVAAVCYRVRSGEVEFLLVQTRGSRRWTFPKGSAETGLTSAQAAALEAFEEAGVHGRIEQTSFARYVVRKSGKSKRKFSPNESVVSAHLCEVLRLSKPKEPGRNRTWFSAQEATRRLRKDRRYGAAAEFARIVEKAVLRIRSLQSEQDLPLRRTYDKAVWQSVQMPSFVQASSSKDALQQVQFEARQELQGRSTRVPLLPNGVRKLETTPPPQPSPAGNPPRQLLMGEVLPFRGTLAPISHSIRKPKAPEASEKR